MTKNEMLIWSDGSSRGNPGSGGWGVVIVSPEKEVIELGGKERRTTNNRMELMAAISAFSFVSKNYPYSNKIIIHTDSSYMINGITKWVHSWRKNNWLISQKKEVLNRDFWERLFSLTEGKKIEWKYVAGHGGTPGNERCDEIATAFADGNDPSLFKGPLSNYSVPLFDLSKVSSSNKKEKSRSKAKVYSYLSMIDGVIMKHKSWEECEKRVKGKSGAKFKKALSAEEEEEIMNEWK